MSKNLSRREFVKKSSLGLTAGAVLMSSTAKSYARILGSNDTINVAVIGIRGRGGGHIDSLARMKNVRMKYIVDVDENLFPEVLKEFESNFGYVPGTEWDMRNVYNDKDIDAVSIATPNHWHALASIWAAQAGKHVYVEKPSTHNVFEGRKMVEAARKYNVLMQVGFQNRSIQNTNRAMKYIHDGNLGKIYMARGLCFKPRADIGIYPDGPMKEGEKYRTNLESDSYETPYTEKYLSKVHYDMWLGPAPKRPFNRNRFHYNWHWHWDYGNGDTGNQGPHQFDVARWGLNKKEYPKKVSSFGGYYAYKSSQETPNVQTSIFEYEDGTILEFATRGLFTNPEGILLPDININSSGQISANSKAKPVTIGNIFLGTEGWLQIDSGGNWQTFFGRNNEPGPTSGDSDDSYDPMNLKGTGGGGHFGNFIEAIRSGKREDLTCDIEEGHISSALPLFANVAYRLGKELKINSETEKFVNDDEANKMLTRKYRDEFVVPEKV
ncbi:MAG: Gfo/Idh/MocA family oxidoreductase [Ignavibacteriae bacterium]|nr:Gfo/Idh/MocA family oxidoreductase [Ignavibacteriota bacterium]MCB9206349.1 Gfo/Idh/MocA family oxidoreductase [Ignavibacteriales bacterium]MCB9208726.1 Gfo/Idh/MocA family oxidoreductase [Ignavibacteriales bacterium]MCB9218356.1 Gfo/Idh/MocA family oxidoreductase [Ignavibacteriales bacterium]MCB9260652.1 Gfo/Idh/MocA family oxidoreductase [Ignavibacteriales bacterium]